MQIHDKCNTLSFIFCVLTSTGFYALGKYFPVILGIQEKLIEKSYGQILSVNSFNAMGNSNGDSTGISANGDGKGINEGLFHFVYGASPHQILLHLPIILLHFPIKFASFPQQIASSPQQVASFPQQIASFPQQNSHFPITILLHFAKN